MSKTIAFLSGKGGSGKTTLSLTIGNMLADCDVRVLIIDCDLQTNGLTYFYEEYLDRDTSQICFWDMLHPNPRKLYRNPIRIKDKLSFIPSIRKIADNLEAVMEYNDTISAFFRENYQRITKDYDIVLLDCAAGYSDVLRYILPLTDYNLVILEADSISMSAMRSLFLKIANYFPDTKFYQVYNKIRENDLAKYTERDGAFFTNIGAIVFDWAIPEAFSLANVPTIDSTGLKFGTQLFMVCSRLFRGDYFQKKLNKYNLQLTIAKNKSERNQLQEEFVNNRAGRKSLFERSSSVIALLSVLVSFSVFIFLLFEHNNRIEDIRFPLALLASVILSFLSVFITRFIQESRERHLKLSIYRNKIEELEKSISFLEESLNNTEGTTGKQAQL